MNASYVQEGVCAWSSVFVCSYNLISTAVFTQLHNILHIYWARMWPEIIHRFFLESLCRKIIQSMKTNLYINAEKFLK